MKKEMKIFSTTIIGILLFSGCSSQVPGQIKGTEEKKSFKIADTDSVTTYGDNTITRSKEISHSLEINSDSTTLDGTADLKYNSSAEDGGSASTEGETVSADCSNNTSTKSNSDVSGSVEDGSDPNLEANFSKNKTGTKTNCSVSISDGETEEEVKIKEIIKM